MCRIIEVKTCEGCPLNTDTLTTKSGCFVRVEDVTLRDIVIDARCMLTGEDTSGYKFSVRRDCPLERKEN